MVILDKNQTSAHGVALRHQGRPVLTHNEISRHPSFKSRVNMGSNFNTNGGARHNLASYIHGKLAIHGVPYNATTKALLTNMVNTIIRLRRENQARFMNAHHAMLGGHHFRRRQLNNERMRIRNNIAAREPNFRKLLENIGKNPENLNKLIDRKNERLHRNERIRNINREKERLARELKEGTRKATEHSRQIAAWRWVHDRILPAVHHLGPRNQ
jgi:hypothetical protein